jgi:hypothetical protein
MSGGVGWPPRRPHKWVEAALPPGRAAIIGVFAQSDRLAVEQTLPGSPAKSVVSTDKYGLKDLQASRAQAMGKFNPDRTVLPIPDRAFGRRSRAMGPVNPHAPEDG